MVYTEKRVEMSILKKKIFKTGDIFEISNINEQYELYELYYGGIVCINDILRNEYIF